MTTRREFLGCASAACGALALGSADEATGQEARKSDILKAAPETWPVPKEVAGIKLPDSKLARDATDYTRALSAPIVFNHVLRTYLFGELLGRARDRPRGTSAQGHRVRPIANAREHGACTADFRGV